VVRVNGLRTIAYEYPLRRPLGDAHLPAGADRSGELAVFLDTDEGFTGVATTSPGAAPHLQSLVGELIGHDPRGVRGLHDALLRVAFKPGVHGHLAYAISALDIALWDLRAKINGVPLWRELGGTSPRVRVYASGLDTPLDDDALAAFYREMSGRLGIHAAKVKVGLDPDRDLARLAIVAEAIAPPDHPGRPVLMIDANEYWTPDQAIRRISEIERHFDLTFVEEPVDRTDHRGLARVARATRAAIATGENLTSVAEFAPLILQQCASVLQVGALTTGVTRSLRIAEVADAFGLQVALVNCPGRYIGHVAAVLSNHIAMEILDAGRDAYFMSNHRVEAGELILSDDAGIGITFDEKALERDASIEPTNRSLASVYRQSPTSRDGF
jgi:L-alanine-DL-glutamate epimerase-like enolase superfamily enzyme